MHGSGVTACPKQPDGAGHRLRLALVGWWETGRGRHMWRRGAELYLPFFRPRRRGGICGAAHCPASVFPCGRNLPVQGA